MPKICLGSANFFNKYGIDHIKVKNFFEALSFSKENSIDKIDYSILYGMPSVKQKKIIDELNFKISLKLPISYEGKFFTELLEENLEFWGTNVENIYLHDPWNLNRENFDKIKNYIYLNKKQFNKKKFGLSIYDQKDLFYFLDDNLFNSLQLPYNPFSYDILNYCKKKYTTQIKFQIRSIFLQGILLKKKLPNSIKNTNLVKAHNNWLKFLSKYSYKSLNYCIIFAQQAKADEVVIGFNNLTQLKDIISIFQVKKNNFVFPDFIVNDKVSDPRYW